MKTNKRLDGKKKLVTLTMKLERDMRSFCRDRGIESESELIRRAISKYIYADGEDAAIGLQGMRQLRDKTEELRDILDLSFRYMKLMHVSLLAYHPEIDPKVADGAFASANARHEKFFAAFADGLGNDPPFFEGLLHRYYSEGDDGQG